MIPVRVEKISKRFNIHTKFGEKEKCVIGVQRLDNNELMDVGFWIDEGFNLMVGEEVTMDVKESKDENGKIWQNASKYERLGAGGINPAPSHKAPSSVKKEVPRGVWEAKGEARERRMVRMNALSHATKIVIHSTVNKDLTEGELSNLVQMTAKTLEDWVYAEVDPIYDPSKRVEDIQ